MPALELPDDDAPYLAASVNGGHGGGGLTHAAALVQLAAFGRLMQQDPADFRFAAAKTPRKKSAAEDPDQPKKPRGGGKVGAVPARTHAPSETRR